MNTRIIPLEYQYEAPKTLKAALDTLAKKSGVRVLAGGTDLIVKMKTGAITDVKTVLDIKKIKELNHVTLDKNAGHVLIGGTTVLADLENEALIAKEFPALHEALKAMAAIAVRHMGTIGGNFANASPVADTAGPVMVYGGKVKLVSTRGERYVDANKFFVGVGKSELQPDELIAEFVLPLPQANVGTAFIKKTRVKADISKISTTVYLQRDGKKIADLRIAMGAVAVKPLLLDEVAAEFIGKPASPATFAAIAQAAAAAIHPIDDIRSTADYRKAVAEVIVADALALAWKRAGGDK